MPDTRALGEQATTFAKQAQEAQDEKERERLYAKAAKARAAIDAENASPVADDDAYNAGRGRGPADRAADDAATAANEKARFDGGGAESKYIKTYPAGHTQSYYDEKGRRTE